MNARINGCNNAKVGISNFLNFKGGCSVKMEIDIRSPTKITPKSVTNNPKATPKSVTNDPRLTPNSVTNDPTFCPKSDKNINTLPQPAPAQIPPQVDCEATLKHTPRRSSRLTRSKKKINGPKSLANGVIYLYEEKEKSKEPIVVKLVAARKLVLKKNNYGTVKA